MKITRKLFFYLKFFWVLYFSFIYLHNWKFTFSVFQLPTHFINKFADNLYSSLLWSDLRFWKMKVWTLKRAIHIFITNNFWLKTLDFFSFNFSASVQKAQKKFAQQQVESLKSKDHTILTEIYFLLLTPQKNISEGWLIFVHFPRQILRFLFHVRRKTRSVRMPKLPHRLPNLQSIFMADILKIWLFQMMTNRRKQINKQLKKHIVGCKFFCVWFTNRYGWHWE